MKFDHAIKYAGKFYNAGEDVPVVTKQEHKPEEAVEEKKPARRGRPSKKE